MNKKIVQIIPTDGSYFVVEELYTGFNSKREVRYKVLSWALVENSETNRWVEPLIQGPRGLVLMDSDSNWMVEKL